MSVSTWHLTTWSVSTASTAAADYMGQIDANMAVAERVAASFAVSEITPSSARNMTVQIQPGWLFNGVTYIQTTAQVTTTLAVPSAFSRIDRVVANVLTGAVSVVSGSESSSPTAPAIPTGYVPLARLTIPIQTTAIGNSMITDERSWGAGALASDYQEFTSTTGGTWNAPGGYSSNSIVMVMGWGGGGGGSGSGAGGGGGGGACMVSLFLLSALTTAVSVTVGAGGAAASAGGDSAFGTYMTFYGGQGSTGTGGGGGAGALGRSSIAQTGGAPNPSSEASYGGGSGADLVVGNPGGFSVYGGAGGGRYGVGGGSTRAVGGNSIYGGGGGAGASTVGSSYGIGLSVFGGNGGAQSGPTGGSGSAPGGGGGAGALTGGAGGRGELRIWTYKGA